MPSFSRTWWGQRFLAALEAFTDPARLGRGRTYANTGRILSHTIANGKVTAKVRGSINPYFGVYEEPIYTTTVAMKPLARADWTAVIAELSRRAGTVAKLLVNELPDSVEAVFASRRLPFLPQGQRDFVTGCSCPDYANPCKHVAGLCYRLAGELDRDPFLLFELRGLSRQELRAELERSPLGRILAAELTPTEAPLVPAESYHTRPTTVPAPAPGRFKEFWTGPRRLPPPGEAPAPASVPALLIRKAGDYPAFWPKDASFLEIMEEIYERVRTKSRALP
jgi:uncharacterized Zn finger protein